MDKTVVVDDMLEVLDYLKRNGQPGACITDMLMRAAQSVTRAPLSPTIVKLCPKNSPVPRIKP